MPGIPIHLSPQECEISRAAAIEAADILPFLPWQHEKDTRTAKERYFHDTLSWIAAMRCLNHVDSRIFVGHQTGTSNDWCIPLDEPGFKDVATWILTRPWDDLPPWDAIETTWQVVGWIDALQVAKAGKWVQWPSRGGTERWRALPVAALASMETKENVRMDL
uniref:Uncharacterized protein n=1 Tax=viral metagenome TaxID=1070528 RepID=A0A6M3XWU3_9ZZZZ